MRVLHLIAPPDLARPHTAPERSDAALRTCVEVIDRTPEHDHDIILIGASDAERRAASLGIRCSDRVSPPAGIATFAWAGVRRLAQRRASLHGRFDRVQPWSTDLVRLARMAGIARVCPPPAELVSTPVGGNRAAIRATLGIHDDRPLVLMLGDPPATIDVRQCWFLAGLFEIAAWPGQVIVPARPTSRSRRLSAPMRLAHATLTDLPTSALVSACDLAAIMPPAHGPAELTHPGVVASVEMVLRAGLPLVVPPGSPLSERMGAIDPSLVALWSTGAALATALGPLLADPERRAALAHACTRAARPIQVDDIISAWHAQRSGVRSVAT